VAKSGFAKRLSFSLPLTKASPCLPGNPVDKSTWHAYSYFHREKKTLEQGSGDAL